MPVPKFACCRVLACVTALLLAGVSLANPVYQPPGANLTFGDVTHGKRAQSASTNPAAAAADAGRGGNSRTRGTVVSFAAGLEYGNIQALFDLYNDVTAAYEPSDPTVSYPGQLPEFKPGLDLGQIWDALDPDVQEVVAATAREVARQAVLLALIALEGHAKAWLSTDASFVFGEEHLGGMWTLGLTVSGSSKAFGAVQPIDFDPDAARQALEDWIVMNPVNRPAFIPLGGDVEITPSPITNAVFFSLNNDSSVITKSTTATELSLGYSRAALSTSAGALYLGAKARLYLMQLSRISARFGDITDTEELFDDIRNSDFSSDEGAGLDIGALWVGTNYQLGAQLTNINEPSFTFPDVNLSPYTSARAIAFLLQDQKYTMDRQLKLEASLFSTSRRWSAHLGLDADSATDPMGDRFQWFTASAGVRTDSWWIPSARIGYRENLTGTKLKYVGIGLTAFKYVNFDISSALDTVHIDGTTLPQGLMLSIGFEINW